MIRDKVKNFIEKYDLTGRFILAFSGGYDSMCLLDVLCNLGADVIAVHLNHNWRGEESLKEAQNCEKFANSRGINYYSEILPDNIQKTETAARKARYDFFRRCAQKFNSKVVFTAHNFDDNAETVLYRIIRGTGTAGLQGISEKREIFYRPLLHTKRKDIEKYCIDNGLTPNKDSSNTDTKYKRNFIRYKVIPLLKEINPDVSNALNSLSEIAAEDYNLINSYLPSELPQASEIEQKRIIYNILTEHNIDYDREKIENIQKFVEANKTSKSGKTISLTDGLWLFVNDKKAEVITKTDKSNTEIAVNKCGEYVFGDYIFSIEPCEEEVKQFPDDNEFKAYITVNSTDFTLRNRKDGDIIHPLGCKGSQKLKKYLNEKKIPQHEKDKLIFLCKGNEVIWAAGLGLSEKAKVAQKATHVLRLKKR